MYIVILFIFFSSVNNLKTDQEINDFYNSSQWLSKSSVNLLMKVYIYNVTNSDDILKSGAKPTVKELGPYVYEGTWSRKNVVFHHNNMVSFNQEKIYKFDKTLSKGVEEDLVIVPNIPMLSAITFTKNESVVIRFALEKIFRIQKMKPFIEVSVGQLLWGYRDPFQTLAKIMSNIDVTTDDKFGLFFGRNGTLNDTLTVSLDKYELIYNSNVRFSGICNSRQREKSTGSEGFLFPPNLTEKSTIYVYNQHFCGMLPLKYEKTILKNDKDSIYRFTFDKECSQNAPSSFYDVSLCNDNLFILLSHPHFYLANDSYRNGVEGISEPDPENDELYYIDINQITGLAVQNKVRLQINLAVTNTKAFKVTENISDTIFPVIWFEEGIVY